MGSEHPEPGGRADAVRALSERERLAEQQLRLGQVTGGVAGTAAYREAACPGCRIGGGQRTVLRELGGLCELPPEIGRPRPHLKGGRASRRGKLNVTQGLAVVPAAGA